MQKVSVIIPCYNHGKYIEETVNSVLASTYPNLEIVITNDGSTDEYTNDILRKLADTYKNVNVITTQNQGTAGACRVAVENSTGDYILPVGSDDKIHSTYIEKAVNILNNNPNIGIVYCNAEFFDKKTGPWILPEFSIDQIKKGNCIFCSALFRKADYDRTEGYHLDMRNWEDYDLWLSILELGREVYKLPEVLFFYRITGVSKTDSVKKNQERGKQLMALIYNHHKKFFDTKKVISTPVSIQRKQKEIYF